MNVEQDQEYALNQAQRQLDVLRGGHEVNQSVQSEHPYDFHHGHALQVQRRVLFIALKKG